MVSATSRIHIPAPPYRMRNGHMRRDSLPLHHCRCSSHNGPTTIISSSSHSSRCSTRLHPHRITIPTRKPSSRTARTVPLHFSSNINRRLFLRASPAASHGRSRHTHRRLRRGRRTRRSTRTLMAASSNSHMRRTRGTASSSPHRRPSPSRRPLRLRRRGRSTSQRETRRDALIKRQTATVWAAPVAASI